MLSKKGEPFVQLILQGSIIAQMTPSQARDHSRAITEAAEQDVADADSAADFARRSRIDDALTGAA